MLGNFVMMVLTILLILLFGGAGIMPALERVDSIIESHPDSAYVMLTAMDRSAMSRKEAAKFSVLYSMALDKRYIDVASDSIICNAVKYYRHHGDADYKMRAYYYQGRVRQNAEDIDGAMESFVKAEHFGRKSDNLLMRGRVYKGMMTLHTKLYDMQSAYTEACKSAECFLAAGDTSRYINSRMEECSCLNALLDYSSSETTLKELESLLPKMSTSQRNRYYVISLNRNIRRGTYSVEQINESLALITNASDVSWLTIARLNNEAGNNDSAVSALEAYEKYNPSYLKSPLYHHLKARVAASLGDTSSAYKHLNDYVNVSDSVNLELMQSSAPYAEERYLAQIKDLKRKWQITWILLISVLGAMAILYVLLKTRGYLVLEQKKSKNLEDENSRLESVAQSYAGEIEQAQSEIKRLKRLRKGTRISDEMRSLMDERLDTSSINMWHKGLRGQVAQTVAPSIWKSSFLTKPDSLIQ